jgi:Ca2+-binding RTX toxin-like protein
MSRSPGLRRLLTTVGVMPAVLVAAALSGCTPTPGGTASVTSQSFSSRLVFDAVSGRNNSMTVSLGAQGDWGWPSALLLTDARNPITPGPGCARVSDNTVRCSIDGAASFGFGYQVIRLGDGNDSYASSVVMGSTVHAGAGNDTIDGGPSADVIYEDSDSLDRDTFSGGGGGDWVLYAGGMHAVNISLNDTADDGRPGEGDNVKSDVENISGTGNADTLTGNSQANTIGGPSPVLDFPADFDQLTGGAVVNGGGGPDEIWGTGWGGAADRLSGGTGDDTIYALTGDDVVSGGAGNDSLWGNAGFDALDGGSETDSCDVGPDGGTAVNCETGP